MESYFDRNKKIGGGNLNFWTKGVNENILCNIVKIVVMLKQIIVFCAFSFILYSCDNSIPSNLLTKVKGKVLDSVKNKYLLNAKVLLYGCKSYTYGISCTELIDSTRTDNNGDFNFTFRTGEGNYGYEVEVDETENHTRDYSSNLSISIEAGKKNNVIVPARELNYLKIRLNILDNPFVPLIMLATNSRIIIYENKKDTTFVLRVLPNSEDLLIYSVIDTKEGRYRKRIDTLQIDFRDTTYITREIRTLDFKLEIL